MKLSIITVNLNNREGLRKTAQSILDQTFTDYEWIVVDGASTDGSVEVANEFAQKINAKSPITSTNTFPPAQVISEPDTGIYNAMNKGILKAQGEYCLFLNSGDSLCDNEVLSSLFCRNFKEDIISGNIIIDDSIYNVRYSPDECEIDYKFMCDSTILHPSSFIKRELFEKYGYYDESLKIVSDWKFFFLCLIQYSCSYRKWERCISSFNTNGISENPRYESQIKIEREKVKSEVLPYVKRTYDTMQSKICDFQNKLDIPFYKKVIFIFKRILRKFSNIIYVVYISIKNIRTKRKFTTDTERLIVSMTSWKKRIENVYDVIESILHNSIKPDLIVINLANTEFPNFEKDLPQNLQQLVTDGIVEILWSSIDTKAFKKFIPTLKKYPNDLILAIDDDFLYPDDFIETFMNEHKKTPNMPLSGNNFYVNGVVGHCGCASLVKSVYFGRYIDELMDENVLNLRMDDIFYVFCAALNGVRYRYVGKLFYTNMRPIGSTDGLSDDNRDNSNRQMNNYLVKKIKRDYHVDMTKISKPYFTL